MTRIVLGCGNFGGIGSAPELFGHGESEEEAFAIMDAAWADGIHWFDTADAYGGGGGGTGNPEGVLAPGARRGSRRAAALRRARHRLPGLQPARGRLAARQVPARRGAPGRLTHDAPARAVPASRRRARLRGNRASRRARGPSD